MLPLMPPGAQQPPGLPPGPPVPSIGGPVPGMGAPMGAGPIPLPPPPAALAGQAAMSLVPEQMAQQAALTQQQGAEVLAMLMSQLGNQPNPVAEAAQGMPAAQVSPDQGVPDGDESMSVGGGY